MGMRKQGLLYDKWHRRVEGQIRHTIGRHPEWFCFKKNDARSRCVNSLAKRIVGEIVADCMLAAKSEEVAHNCFLPMGKDGAVKVPPSGRSDDLTCHSPGKPDQ